MIEGATLILITAIAVNKNVAAERILVLYASAVSGDETNQAGDNRPRPLDLGEPT